MVAADEVRLARVALSWLAEAGDRRVWQRVRAHGPVRVRDGLLAAGADAPWWGDPDGPAVPADPRARAEVALAAADRLGARVVVPEDAEWPTRLDELAGIGESDRDDRVRRFTAPPLCLWVRGPRRLDEALARAAAVVGARAATGYGQHVSRTIAYGLADRGWTVVSGGAYGIDAHAHRGALAAGGGTVVVLACGVERAYPAGHANLFDRVVEDGLLVSEYPPGSDPYPQRFLIRNRIIAAATLGTVVVEAGARSGARQTLRRARQLGRPRLLVPGPVTSAMSVGCHLELRGDPGSRLVTGAPEVLEEIGRLGADLAPVPRGPRRPRDELPDAERRLVEALRPGAPLSSEMLAARARVPLPEATRLLPGLVVGGFAQRRDGGFVLAPAARPDHGPAA